MEDEEDEEEFDYDDEEIEKGYDPLVPTSKIDKKLSEELKDAWKFKLAEGVKMVEYDEFGLPKT